MAGAPPRQPDPSGLTWFQPPPSEEKGQTSRFSLAGWFRRKDPQAASTAVSAAARPTALSIRKSELELKEEKEDAKAEMEGAAGGVDDLPRREGDTSSNSQRGYAPRSFSPSLYSGVRRESDQTMAKPRGSEQSLSGPVVTRSLTTVLKHLTSLVERRGQDPSTYSDSDFRQYWMPDSQCKECYDCGEKFTTFRRRHHCRLCGQIFCSRCCNQEVSGNFIGFRGNLRVCTYCCKVILSYAQSAYSSGDLKSLQEDLTSEADPSTPSSSTSLAGMLPPESILSPRKKILGFMDDDQRKSRAISINSMSDLASSSVFEAGPSILNPTDSEVTIVQERKLLDSAQLRDLWCLIKHPGNGIMFQNRRYRLRTYPECIIGSELVDWLIQKDKAALRVQALAIGQALLDAKWLKCVTSSYQTFNEEYALYSQGDAAEAYADQSLPVHLDEKGEFLPYAELMEPSWFREIDQEEDPHSEDDMLVSSEGNSREGTWEMMNGDPPSPTIQDSSLADHFGGASPISQPSPSIGQNIPWMYDMMEPSRSDPDPDQDQGNDQDETLVLDTLKAEANKILVSFLEQELYREGLDMSWRDLILPLAKRICSTVKPNVTAGDSMDIRYYVHIKRVPGGTRADCSLYKGTICTKNVAHKKMASKQTNPKILLLQAAIEHQRVQNKFASLEPLVLQEHEYLKNCVAKIVALKPTILVVEQSVARLAQEFLLACDVTVVLNVKEKVVFRIARQTEGTSIKSINQVSAAGLGTCQSFYLQKYNLPGGFTKTLMFFDGCPSHLGCSVVLRGGSLAELSKVKKILKLMVYAVYHSRLETAFLRDEFAMPPIAPPFGESPPNSPPTPMSQTPSKQAFQDTGTLKEVIQAVRIEQAMKRKLVDDASGESRSFEGGAVGQANPPTGKSSFKSAVQKILMGKGKEGSDRSASSSAAGSRRGSDGDISSHGPEMAEKSSTRQGRVPEEKDKKAGADQLGNGEALSSKIRCEASPDGRATGGLRKNGDPADDELGEDFVFLEDTGDDCDPTLMDLRHSEQVALSCEEVTVKDSQVEMLSELEEERQVFNFDVTDNDSEAEEATETSEDSSGNMQLDSDNSKDRFSRVYKETFLTTSPFLSHLLPFFETEEGRHSPNRHFFPEDIYWSKQLTDFPNDQDNERVEHEEDKEEVVYWSTDRCTHKLRSIDILQPHPFTFVQITEMSMSDSMRTLLADFRARGGRYVPKNLPDAQLPPTPKNNQSRDRSGIPRVMSKQYLMASKGDKAGNASDSDHPVFDCFDPSLHQQIALQFSSYSNHSGGMSGHCITPWIVTMEFYGRTDITLGMFLEKYCFNRNYYCPNENCNYLMAYHVRRFVHGNASIQVLQRQLDSPVPGYSNKVLMWSWCRKCKQVTPVQPMSRETWHMSFAKYLDIRFHGKDYGRRGGTSTCTHALHHHYYQYFGQHNMVASFKYSPIILREIAFPPIPIDIDRPYRAHANYAEETRKLAARASQVFHGIHSNISSLTSNRPNVQLEQEQREFVLQYEADMVRFKTSMEELEGKIHRVDCMQASASQKGADYDAECDGEVSVEDHLLDIEDSIVITKRVMCETIFAWNSRFQEFLVQEKEKEKQRKKDSLLSSTRKVSTDTDGGTPTLSRRSESTSSSPGLTPLLTPMHSMEQSTPVFINTSQLESSTSKQGSFGSNQAGKRLSTVHERIDKLQSRDRGDSDVSLLGDPHLTSDDPKMFDDLGISAGLNAGLEYRPEKTSGGNGRLSPRGSLNYLGGSPRESGSPSSSVSSPSRTAVFSVCMDSEGESDGSSDVFKGGENVTDEAAAEKTKDDEGKKAEVSGASGMESKPGAPSADDQSSTAQPTQTHSVDSTDGKGNSKNKPGMVKQILNQFLQPTESFQIETPFPADQHHTLAACSIVPVIVYDQELSSIIAYALSSEQYCTKLYEKQQSYSGSGHLTPGAASLGSGQGSSPASGQTSPYPNRKLGGEAKIGGGLETKDLSRTIGQLKRKLSQGMMRFQRNKSVGGGLSNLSSIRDESGAPSITIETQDDDTDDAFTVVGRCDDTVTPHIELQFSDQTNTQFFCGVYFASQFQKLRKTVFPAGEDVYIRSLSRCMQWVARGGKSGSKFMKTLDDRLILKQMSNSEAHSFLKFAPHYFNYIQGAHDSNKPTALAKILGVYKVGFQNHVTNTGQKLDLLVQENLFYKRRIAQVFDLKGSMRNRHVKTMGAQTQDLVLMDENLLKHMVDSPLYIRMHSKTALAMAIQADTEFLSSHLVMDYSLLVGLDETSKELVIGIIDFIRTFTWDKKLETFVKAHAGNLLPTVVSPEIYRTRFLEAMDKYFLLVPDRWTGLGKDASGFD